MGAEKHMMMSSSGNIFPRYWPCVRGIHRSPVDSPHKGQWRRAFMFALICNWTNGWANNRDARDLKRHYDVTLMRCWTCFAMSNERENVYLSHHMRSVTQFLQILRQERLLERQPVRFRSHDDARLKPWKCQLLEWKICKLTKHLVLKLCENLWKLPGRIVLKKCWIMVAVVVFVVFWWHVMVNIIGSDTKWPLFCRRNLQRHFLEWKLLNFKQNFIEIFSLWSIWQYFVLIQRC